MKKYILITTLFLSLISYSQSNHNNYQILDSLKYVKNLPDENFYPKRDKIVEKTINIHYIIFLLFLILRSLNM